MPFSMTSTKRACMLTAIGGFALMMSPSVARAGFDWTPPAQQAPSKQVATSDAPVNGPLTPEPVEVIDVAPSVVKEPIPVDVKKSEPVKIAEPVSEPVKAPEKAPEKIAEPVAKTDIKADVKKEEMNAPKAAEAKAEMPAPAPQAAAPINLAPAVAQPALVEGFAKDVPLALALRDIVPPSYAFVFASGDIAGMKASWRGGKVWTEVLKSALDKLDLQSSISGNVVTISKKGTAAAAPVGYSARMSSPDVIVRETPVAAAPKEAAPKDVKDTKKEEIKAEKTPQVIEFPSAPPKQEAPAPVVKAPEPQKVPVVDMNMKTKWQARPGMTLRQVLEAWCKTAGVELNWSTAYDYPIDNAFYFEGTYGQAIDAILMSFGGQTPAPKGRLYPNLPDGPSVLMIN